MCELSGKLMAWLDHELESDEMAGVERHIEECAECQREVAAYREVSATFHSYCDAVMESRERRAVATVGAGAVGCRGYCVRGRSIHSFSAQASRTAGSCSCGENAFCCCGRDDDCC